MSAASAAFHQSSGSCSDHPGCGDKVPYGFSERASMSPSGERAMALTPVVPTSSPTRAVMPARERGCGELLGRSGHREAITGPRRLPVDLALSLEDEQDREAARRLDELVGPEERPRLLGQAEARLLGP